MSNWCRSGRRPLHHADPFAMHHLCCAGASRTAYVNTSRSPTPDISTAKVQLSPRTGRVDPGLHHHLADAAAGRRSSTPPATATPAAAFPGHLRRVSNRLHAQAGRGRDQGPGLGSVSSRSGRWTSAGSAASSAGAAPRRRPRRPPCRARRPRADARSRAGRCRTPPHTLRRTRRRCGPPIRGPARPAAGPGPRLRSPRPAPSTVGRRRTRMTAARLPHRAAASRVGVAHRAAVPARPRSRSAASSRVCAAPARGAGRRESVGR